VFFVPHPRERARRMVELQEAELDDVIAGLGYLKSLPFVDPALIAISGCSYGGIQTLLTGERDPGVKALVPFAPAAMAWERNPEIQDRLLRAIAAAKVPVFLIQAQNDYSLGPSHALANEAKKKQKDFQSKIYPKFGQTPQDGHWQFCSAATEIWGNDVLAFLEAHMKAKP
jgi:dienelactone hydrolase